MGEDDELVASSFGQLRPRGPVGQQPQHGGRAEITGSQDQRGRIGDLQVSAQPVEQPDLVASGALIVAGDRAQLPAQLTVSNELAQRGVPVQRKQTARRDRSGTPPRQALVVATCRAVRARSA
ncbi:MAG: hypothetical protein ACRDSL_20945 [Pseudonocardiaceae bacterium]